MEQLGHSTGSTSLPLWPAPGHGLNFSEDVIHKCSLNQAQAQNFTVEAKLIARIHEKPNPRR